MNAFLFLFGVVLVVAGERICRLVAKVADLDEEIVRLKTKAVEQEKLIYVDQLTDIGNRRRYDEAVRAAVSHALRTREPLSLMIGDLDRFKTINDRYGHPVGDQALAYVAAILRRCIRPTDVVCRLGGDEFVIILVDADAEAMRTIAARVSEAFAMEPFAASFGRLELSMTFGGAVLSDVSDAVRRDGAAVSRLSEDLYRGADEELLGKKSKKKTRA